MTEIAEAYLKLRWSPKSTELQGLGERVQSIAVQIAKHVYRKPVEIEIELEEGSVKIWVTVIATLTNAYFFVGNYKGLKESVSEACSDARRFGFDVCGTVSGMFDAHDITTVRKESRLKIPGRLLRVMDRLERLEDDFETTSPSVLKKELKWARGEVRLILKKLSAPEAKIVLDSLEGVETPTFPKIKSLGELPLLPSKEGSLQLPKVAVLPKSYELKKITSSQTISLMLPSNEPRYLVGPNRFYSKTTTGD